MQTFTAQQADFVERLQPQVETAFNARYPRVRFLEFS